MARIEYKNDQTRALEESEGSDGRLNVDARSGSLPYHVSKHKGQAYAFVYEHLAGADAEYSFYLQNTSTSKTMVIESVDINASALCSVKMEVVTGTAAGAGDVIPRNVNLASANDAVGVFKQDTGGAITGLTDSGSAIDYIQVGAGGHEELKLNERLRLGQNDAVALEIHSTATTSDVFGVIFFHYE